MSAAPAQMKAWLALIAALACVVPVSAQFSEGTIRGDVRDPLGLPITAASVTAVDAAGVARSTVTDARGVFLLTALPPGPYTLTIESRGFSPVIRRDVQVSIASEVVLDVRMAAAGPQETIEVVAQRPALDAALGIDVTGDTLKRFPLNSRRDWSDALEMTPGVISVIQGPSRPNAYLARGGDSAGHVVQIDGLDVGSFFVSAPGSFTTNAMAVVGASVKTAGVDASTPTGIGIVMNVVTQSGADRPSATVVTLATPARWNDDNSGGGTSEWHEVVQADLSGGGPLMKRRAWAFAGYRFLRRDSGIPRTSKNLADLGALVPGFVPFDNRFRTHYGSLKLTTQAAAHRVEASYHRDLNPTLSGGSWDASPVAPLLTGGTVAGVTVNSVITRSVVSRLSLSVNEKEVASHPATRDLAREGPSRLVHESVFHSAGRLVGSGVIARLDNAAQWLTFPSSKVTVQGDVALHRSGRLGMNALKLGVYLQPRLRVEERTEYANGGLSLEEVVLREPGNPGAGYIPFHRTIVNDTTATTGSSAATNYAAYVQNTWSPAAKLAIATGLRVDRFTNTDRLSGLTFHDSVNIGPRFQVGYSLTADGSTVARASWGRVHDMPQSRALSPSFRFPQVIDAYDVDLDGAFETVFVTPPTDTAANREYDPDTHLAFVDEWTISGVRRFAGGLTLEAAFVRRNQKDRPALVDTNAVYEGRMFVGYRNEAFNTIHRVTNNRWNWFVYSGVDVAATQRIGTLNLFGAYTRGFQHVEGTWAPNDPASIIQPSAFPNNRGLEGWRDSIVGGYSTLTLTNMAWQKHIVRAHASWTGPAGIALATMYWRNSGPYSGPILTRIAGSDPQFGPATVRLSNGRLVTNPLATTLRFAFPTRGEGQVQAPAVQGWNVRIGRVFRVGAGELEPTIDVYNVTNGGHFQRFLPGGNQVFSPNYAVAPDGTFRGQSRQPPRMAQASVRWSF